MHAFLLRVSVLALLLATACQSLPPRPSSASVRRPLTLDVLHYDLNVSLDLAARYVRGEADITLAALPGKPLTQVELDAVELNVSSVTNAAGNALPFQLAHERLIITLAEPLPPGTHTTLHIRWDAFPRRGLYFEGPSQADPTRPWHVWSQGQSHEARFWFPCWDQPTDRATHRLSITVDEHLITQGSGALVESESHASSGQRTDTWVLHTPVPVYLINMVAGQLGSESLDGPLPLPVLARPRDLQSALFATRLTSDMLAFIEELTGRAYPFPAYAQVFVDDFTAGGMENVTATTMYDEGLHLPSDEPQADISALVAHELAHQWFGDLITCNGWHEVWLNEGFADWITTRWVGHRQGKAEMERRFLDSQFTGCQAELDNSRPVVFPQYESPDDMFDGHSYDGAAARIRYLAHTVGEGPFRTALAEYVQRYEAQLVTTEQFQDVFEEVTRSDLSRFFDEWFHGPGYPVIEASASADGQELVLRQTQASRGWRKVFALRFDVVWSRGGNESRAEVSFDASPEARVPLQGQGNLDWVRIDAGAVLPGERWLQQPAAAWGRQLTGASDPMTRLVAAFWFADDPWTRATDSTETWGAESVPVLRQAAGDSWWAVRQQVAVAAGALDLDFDNESLQTLLLDLTQDPDARVATTALQQLHPDSLARDTWAVVRSAANDDNGYVAAAAATLLVKGKRPEALSTLQRLLAAEQEGGGRIRLARDLVRQLPGTEQPEVLPMLMGLAATHPERWVRDAAVSTLAVVRAQNEEAVWQQLCASLNDEAYNVRRAAVRALAGDGDLDDRTRRQLRARWDREVDPAVLSALEDALR